VRSCHYAVLELPTWCTGGMPRASVPGEDDVGESVVRNSQVRSK
jgi:hypothetical protein